MGCRMQPSLQRLSESDYLGSGRDVYKRQIIGIASIISIASTIQGTNEQIKQNLIGAGNNNVDVRLYQGESEYWMDNGLPDNISVISDEQKEQIRSLEGVESATCLLYTSSIPSSDRSSDVME